LVAVALLLGGCQTPPSSYDDGVSAVQWDDIPAPLGMRLRERYHESHTKQVGSWRYADLVYAGRLPVAEVSAYLRERMPLHAWQLTEHRADSDAEAEVLRFRRGQYVAECNIVRQPSSATELLIKVRTQRNKS
jgi:hypothetical protein